MLRHVNDGEADSKIRYKVLRAVKIQGLNFDSKKSLFDFRLVSKAWGKPSNRYLFTPRRYRGANGRRDPQKIICLQTYFSEEQTP